jgi:integrase
VAPRRADPIDSKLLSPRRSPAASNRQLSARRVAAIRYAHKLAGHDDPPTSSEVVKATVHGRRMLGAVPARKAPATADKVVAMAALAETDLIGLRDRAILLLGFTGAFRRSALVAIEVSDLDCCESGMRVHIRRSDTIAISLSCPARSPARLRRFGRGLRWLEASQIDPGPLFRRIGKSGRVSTSRLADYTVVRVVKVSARRVGLDPELYAGHSLRSGFLTSGAGEASRSSR